MLLGIFLLCFGYFIGHRAGEHYTRRKLLEHINRYEACLMALYHQYPVRCTIMALKKLCGDISSRAYERKVK